MSFLRSRKNTANDLQRINEEMYKRNAELAVKNRTLSLLYALYELATQTVSISDLALKMTKTIEKSLELPFFGLAIASGAKKQIIPVIAAVNQVDKVRLLYREKNEDPTGLTESSVGIVDKKLLSTSRRQLVGERFLHKIFPAPISTWEEYVKKTVPIFYAFPLRVNRQVVGFLFLGLRKKFNEVDVFEQELIANIINVVAISLDNSINYQQLVSANIRLQELDRQKTEFLSIASHQLRTPLSIIKGYLELIGDGAYGKPTNELINVLGDMDESNERLIALVDEFLDVSRIEQGRTKFSFALCDINDLITGVVKELSVRADDKKIGMVWSPNASLSQIMIDEERIRHVVFNFVDNAIKYSEHGTVTVQVEAKDNGVSVTVSDEGLGFNKEDEVNFFQKFYRGKNVEGINVNGTGLGIYVCRQFIEAHGGRVWAHSPGLGKGSEFGFWIPLKQATRAS